MIVVDANVVIAASDPQHVHHEQSQRLLARSSGPLLLHSITLAEILVGPARAGALALAERRLAAAGLMLAPDGDPSPSAVAAVRAETTLKMPDACVLALAELLGTPLATFDQRLARVARERGGMSVGLEG